MISAAQNTREYGNDYNYDQNPSWLNHEQPVEIIVIDGDCLDAAMFFKEKFRQSNPVVLNMASSRGTGGGWKNGMYNLIELVYFIIYIYVLGAGAQEENLHRRTNMLQCLEDPYHELEGLRDWQSIPEVSFLK